ncbi:hypothetical protein [Bosea sp. FBZP-16]|uniref:hypothetical protein n=1 Tax=Bosea sp. FBZP-16 TaxID=2065382 RepID=UPI000C308FD2|nr:hypothetical protein [Bosea sp. FBZP-16]
MSILLSRARDGHCRWIVCEGVKPRRGEPVDIFGGRRVCGEPAIWPTSYCAEHVLRVYAAAPVVKDPIDFTSRSAPPALDRQPELTEIFG